MQRFFFCFFFFNLLSWVLQITLESPNTVSIITLWQWSTPHRLTPATSLPSLLVRPASRSSLLLRVRSVTFGNPTGRGGEMFGHWKRVNLSTMAENRRRALPDKLKCCLVGNNYWGGEMFGSGRQEVHCVYVHSFIGGVFTVGESLVLTSDFVLRFTYFAPEKWSLCTLFLLFKIAHFSPLFSPIIPHFPLSFPPYSLPLTTHPHTPSSVRRLVRACQLLCLVMSARRACPPTRVHWGPQSCLSPAGRQQQRQPRSPLLQARWVTGNYKTTNFSVSRTK